jgi:hypothetical protein
VTWYRAGEHAEIARPGIQRGLGLGSTGFLEYGVDVVVAGI